MTVRELTRTFFIVPPRGDKRPVA